MTWDEFKKSVDEFLAQQNRDGAIQLNTIDVFYNRMALPKTNMHVSNKGRGPEEALQVWHVGV